MFLSKHNLGVSCLV